MSQREIAERERVIGVLETELARLRAEVKAREQDIRDRQTLRWWFLLPWRRLQSWRGRKV